MLAEPSTSGSAAVSAPAGCGAAGEKAGQGFFERTGLPIGLQVYTLGDEAGKDIDATFASIAEIGFREIELPGLLGRTPADLKAASDRAGLAIGSIHVPLAAMGPVRGLTFDADASLIADTLGTLGAKWAVAPIALFPENFRPGASEDLASAIARAFRETGPDIWKRTAAILNRQSEALKPLGVEVGYHNHNIEFIPLGETNGWEILVDETDEGTVAFEIDLGWISTAGFDPATFLDQHAGRVSLIHVKDVARGNPSGLDLSMMPAEVGAGTHDWTRLLPAAHAAGARHFYVEQEPPFAIPRIEAARRGYRFLSQLKA